MEERETTNTFSDLLRDRLGDQTLEDFGEKIGVSQAMVSRWLRQNASPPPIPTVQRIASRLREPELPWLIAAYPDLPWIGTDGSSASDEEKERFRQALRELKATMEQTIEQKIAETERRLGLRPREITSKETAPA